MHLEIELHDDHYSGAQNFTQDFMALIVSLMYTTRCLEIFVRLYPKSSTKSIIAASFGTGKMFQGRGNANGGSTNLHLSLRLFSESARERQMMDRQVDTTYH